MILSTHNLIDARNNRLEQALRCMQIMNQDLAILTETKLGDQFHAATAFGYEVVTSEKTNGHQGGVALVYRKSDRFHLEGTKAFGPNVIRATLVSGRKKWRIIGAYVPPSENYGRTLDFIAAAAAISSRLPLILLGDLNVNLKSKDAIINERQAETAAVVASLGLQDLNQNFVQRKGIGDWTWHQWKENNHIISRCDYILTTARSDFKSFRLKEPRFDSDHRLLQGELNLDSKTQHRRYVKRRARFEHRIRPEQKTRADHLMEELAALIEQPRLPDREYNSWISPATWKLIDLKAEARRCRDNQRVKSLKRRIQKAIKADRKRRIEKASEEIENLLTAGRTQEAYGKARCWYRDRSAHVPKPTIQEEEKTREQYESLYTAEEPPGDPIPIHVQPFPVVDSPPTNSEVCAATAKLKNGKSPGANGIRAEHLKRWMRGANCDEPIPAMVDAWGKVLELVNLVFTGKPLPKMFGIGVLVLIPKGAGSDQLRGISLLDLVYKVVSSIINARLAKAIVFHDAVHGFRARRGTGTATIEVKLRMQLAKRKLEPWYAIFLDMKKAYDTVDRDRTLLILEGYGVGENIRRIIKQVWDMDTMVPKQAGFFGKSFGASRGVRQGDIDSPIIFNIVCDAVIRHTHVQLREEGVDTVDSKFYADDGIIDGNDSSGVQRCMDLYTENFARIGLKMNAQKTKAMIVPGGRLKPQHSAYAYNRARTGVGLSSKQRSLQKITCEKCGSEVGRSYLPQHQKSAKCKRLQKDYTAPPPNSGTDQSEAEPSLPDLPPTEYAVSVGDDRKVATPCPVPGCPGKPTGGGYGMRLHFRVKHRHDTVIVNEEGELPYPKCESCHMQMMNPGDTHKLSQNCIRWTKDRENRENDEVYKKAVAETVFTVDGQPIENVKDFRYLGRVLSSDDKDLTTMERNLTRARYTWARFSKVLCRAGAEPRKMASFYRAVVQSVLLFGSETWVLTQPMQQRLDSFHKRCARYITGRHIRQNPDGTWTYPPSDAVLEEAGLWTIQKYIARRRATIFRYVSSRPIYAQCVNSKPLASNNRQLVWWSEKPSDLVAA